MWRIFANVGFEGKRVTVGIGMKDLETELDYERLGDYHLIVSIHTWLDDVEQSWMRVSYIIQYPDDRRKFYYTRYKHLGYYRTGEWFREVMKWEADE